MNRLHINRKQAEKIGLVLLVVILVLGGLLFGKSMFNEITKDKVAENNNICLIDELGAEYKASLSTFEKTDLSKTAEIVNKIKQKPSHKESVNCLYIVGKYGAAISNHDDVVTYYEELLKRNKSDNVWFDSSLGPETAEDIEATVAFVKSQQSIPKDISTKRPIPPVEVKQ